MTLVSFAIAWVAGILIAEVIGLPWQGLALLGIVALLCLYLRRNSAIFRVGALCLLAFALGAGRLLLQVPEFDENDLASYNDCGWISLEGVIVADPDVRENATRLRVRAESVTLPDGTERDVAGRVLATTSGYAIFKYGDEVHVEGLLRTPPVFEPFDYREYLAHQRIYSLISRGTVARVGERRFMHQVGLLFLLRHRARAVIAGILPEPQAALLTGILLGIETGIPKAVMNAFSATGTTHIIAISGFNLTIISGILASLAERLFGRRWSFWFAAAGVALYTVLVGASAAVVRASLMAGVFLLGRHTGRKAHGPTSLAAAAVLMTVSNPYALWDMGFLLSFAATLGLVLYADRFSNFCQRRLERFLSADRVKQFLGLLNDALIATLAASVVTLPIIMVYSGELSLVSLLTNCLILPVQSFLMLIGAVATLLAMVFRPLGLVVGWVAWVFLTYTIETVRLCARLPWAVVSSDVSLSPVVIYYALVAGITWWWTLARGRRQELKDVARKVVSHHLRTGLVVGSSVILVILACCAWHDRPDGRLHVVFLDVDQGDAIFIQTPGGRQILVDGGPSGSALLSQLGRHMPFWDRSLDLVMLTHSDSDHVTGLVPVLERFRVDHIVYRAEEASSDAYARWLELADTEGAVIHSAQAGQEIALDQGVRMTVFYPESEFPEAAGSANNRSLVTRLEYGRFAVLLPGDIEAPIEDLLVAQGAVQPCLVLKAAHHGSCTSTTPSFLDAVAPEVVVISVGADNEFGHPCDGVLERLAGLQVYRTDEDGTIELVTDGSQYWVKTER